MRYLLLVFLIGCNLKATKDYSTANCSATFSTFNSIFLEKSAGIKEINLPFIGSNCRVTLRVTLYGTYAATHLEEVAKIQHKQKEFAFIPTAGEDDHFVPFADMPYNIDKGQTTLSFRVLESDKRSISIIARIHDIRLDGEPILVDNKIKELDIHIFLNKMGGE